LQTGGHLHKRLKIKLPHRPQRHDKTAVIKPRHGVALPQNTCDPLHAGSHGVLCRRFAETVGQPIHVVEPHRKAGRGQPRCRADAQDRLKGGDDLRRRHHPAGGAGDGCQKVCLAQRYGPEQPDHQGQTQSGRNQCALAPQPEGGQCHRRKKNHHFGTP